MLPDAVNPLEYLVEKYLVSLPFIKNGDIVMDIGCNEGTQIAWIKNHLKEKGIEITAIGVDEINYLDEEYTGKFLNQLNEFICSKVADMSIENAIDVLTYFGASVNDDECRESLAKMSEFLKPDGIAILEVREKGDLAKATQEDIDCADKRKYDRDEYVFEKYHITYRKKMTKQELYEHSKHDVLNLMVDSCDHGVILNKKHNIDIRNYYISYHR